MSLASWKKRFLEIRAEDLIKQDPTDMEMLEHARSKWIGLRKSNLKRFKVEFSQEIMALITKDDRLSSSHQQVGASSCALCQKYMMRKTEDDSACTRCPLYQVRDVPCTHMTAEEEELYDVLKKENQDQPCLSPMGSWLDSGSTDAMESLIDQAMNVAEMLTEESNEGE